MDPHLSEALAAGFPELSHAMSSHTLSLSAVLEQVPPGTSISRDCVEQLQQYISAAELHHSSDSAVPLTYPKPKGPGTHPCPFCGKEFVSPAPLETHIRVHTGYRPFKCTKCGRAFNQKGSLKRHMIAKHSVRKVHLLPYDHPL